MMRTWSPPISRETGKVASAKNPRKWARLFDYAPRDDEELSVVLGLLGRAYAFAGGRQRGLTAPRRATPWPQGY